ncbi:MAG: S-layer homology domain-containing protein [Oscillospiraceae bacterium]|jgi:hypothetical protein|nr:S-layer homology domain-containing protein [Oscillospiraceae bacterium]
MTKRTSRRLLAALLAVVMVVAILSATVFGADTITVYIDFEGYNLGQGFYIEPTKLTVPAGTTAGEVTVQLLKATGHDYTTQGSKTEHDTGRGDGFYLASVKGFGVNAPVAFPSYMVNSPGFDATFALDWGRYDPEWLGEFDYTSTAGWMLTVNNIVIGHGAGAETLTDGGVIRWQFTVEGLGADLGLYFRNEDAQYGGVGDVVMGGDLLFTQSNKDALIRALFEDTATAETIATAKAVIINPLSTAAQISTATTALLAPATTPTPDPTPTPSEEPTPTPTPEPEPTDEPTDTPDDTQDTDNEVVIPWVNTFTDVKSGDWYFGAVKFVSENALMNGLSATRFAPSTNLTRAMLVTILYRYVGEPTVTGANPFSDVRAGQWYTNAVIWANANGIVTGYGGGRFGTENDITREDLVTILYRSAQRRGLDTDRWASLAAFTDAGKISGYAVNSVTWGVASGLISGRTAASLVPKGNASRAEIATILQRFIESTK